MSDNIDLTEGNIIFISF